MRIMTNSFSVVVLTGGSSRTNLIAKCIDSINNQTYKNIQKILINNARPVDEMNQISSYGLDNVNTIESNRLSDWEVISLEVSAFDPQDYTSVWKVPGILAMTKVVNKYLFCLNDDDYIDANFFQNISDSFTKYPDAITAFGFPLSYEVKSGKVSYPISGSWELRPEYEEGLTVSSKYLKYDPSYHPNPGFSFVCLTEKVRPIEEYFFSGGFPDLTALMQIVPFGKTIFNRQALMYLGRHDTQQRDSWDEENRYGMTYKRYFSKMLKINLESLRKLNNQDKTLEKLVKYYFLYVLVESSFYGIYEIVKHIIKRDKQTLTVNLVLSHLFMMIKHPIIIARVSFKEFKNIRILKRVAESLKFK